ncbi:MAG TPA: class I SAM-dependent methyltransferase [Rhizorhapis sp.]
MSNAIKPFPVTHQHIFNVIRTYLDESDGLAEGRPLRVLDIGCGDGRMMHSLHALARQHWPGRAVEVHGFDIGEHGFKDDGQMAAAIDLLTASHPGVDWKSRIRIIPGDASWGYPPGWFDIAVSNQVIEHVEELTPFLRNLREALAPNGISVHLFPLSHCMQEAHVRVPFSHWIRDFHYRVAWIKLMSRLGIGKYRHDRRILGHADVQSHAIQSAKFIECWTSYRSFREITAESSRLHMATSYNFTKDFFFTKLRMILRRPASRPYRRRTAFGLEWLGFMSGRYLSSSTLVIQPLDYDIGARIAAEKAEKIEAEKAVVELA